MEVAPEQRPFIDLVQVRCPETPSDPGSLGSGGLVLAGIGVPPLSCLSMPDKGWTDSSVCDIHRWRALRAKPPPGYCGKVGWRPPDRKDPADRAGLKIGEDAPPAALLDTFF